jgi:hypothetical protein
MTDAAEGDLGCDATAVGSIVANYTVQQTKDLI